MTDTTGQGSNFTDENRAKDDKYSHQSQSSSDDMKTSGSNLTGGSSSGQGKGNFDDQEQHREAGEKGGSK